MQHSLEDLFARFQRTADPRALAAVYDQVAPDLLLLAVHLGAREGDAEDLLQATFVAAIQSASSYQSGRPLLPWLMGILGNQAKHLWRDRRRHPDADRAPLPSPGGPDPLEAASNSEFADEFARKLRGLPSGYRDALTLRFVHDLTPTQIAHSLGVPVETVKTRLKRGTDLLRRALPAGFAALVIARTTPARDLASVRTAVLAAAKAARAARTPTLLGVAIGIRTLIGLAVVLAGGLLLWPHLFGGETAPTSIVGSNATSSTPAETDRERPSDATPPRTSSTSSELAREFVLVRYADGMPAVGARVSVIPRDVADPLLHERSFIVDSDGRLPVAPDPQHTLLLVADRGGRAEWSGGTPPPELIIPRGVDVEVHVVDGARPVEGVVVTLSRAQRPDELLPCGITDGAGVAHLRSVEPGRTLSVLADAHAPGPLRSIEGIAGSTQIVAFDLAGLRSRWSITATVLDADGAPAAHARVQLGSRLPFLQLDNPAAGDESRTPPIDLWCDAEGRFARSGFTVFGGVIPVWVRAAGHPILATTIAFESGSLSREVVLRLPRARGLSGRVVGDHDRPERDVEITVVDVDGGDAARAPRWATGRARSSEDGTFALTGLPETPLRAVAIARDGRRAHARFDTTGDLRFDARLEPSRSIRGFVTDPRSAPIAGLSVRGLVDSGRTEPAPTTTDAQGAFELADCDAGTHTVWITDPSSPWTGRVAALPALLAGPGAVQLVVPDALRATTTIRGRVIDSEGRPLAADLALGNLQVGRTFAATDPIDGSFRIGPLPALPHWDLAMRDSQRRWAFRGDIRTTRGETTDLGDIVLQRCGRVHAVIDRSAVPALGRVVMKVVTQDAVVCDEIELRDGTGRSGPLPFGEYRVFLVGDAIAMCATTVTIVAEGDIDVGFRATVGIPFQVRIEQPDDGWDLRARLEWRHADGSILCRDQVQLARGKPFTVDRSLPAGSYTLLVETHAGRRGEVRVDLAQGAPAMPLVVEPR